MFDEQTSDIVITCAAGMVKVILICIIGIIAAKYPQDSPALTPKIMQGISKIANILFMPALITISLGKGLTLDAFISIGLVSFCMCTLVILISGLLSYILGLLFIKKDTPLMQMVIIACAFSNSVPIPALLLAAVCKYDKIHIDYDDIDECYVVGMSTVFVYQIIHSTLFWGGVSVYINENLLYFQQSPMETVDMNDMKVRRTSTECSEPNIQTQAEPEPESKSKSTFISESESESAPQLLVVAANENVPSVHKHRRISFVHS